MNHTNRSGASDNYRDWASDYVALLRDWHRLLARQRADEIRSDNIYNALLDINQHVKNAIAADERAVVPAEADVAPEPAPTEGE